MRVIAVLVLGLLPLSVATAGGTPTPDRCSLAEAAAVVPVTGGVTPAEPAGVTPVAPSPTGAASTSAASTSAASTSGASMNGDQPPVAGSQTATTMPTESSVPHQAAEPGETSVPGQTTVPGGTTMPGETVVPGETTVPGETAVPGGEGHNDTLGEADGHDDAYVPLPQRPSIPFLPEVGRHTDQAAAAAEARATRTSLVSLLAAAQDERQAKWALRAGAVQRVADAAARLRLLGAERAARVDELVAAHGRLEQAARDGFVQGSGAGVATWLAADGHPGVARSLVRSVQDREQGAVVAWGEAVAEADTLVQQAVCEQIAAGDELAAAELAVGAADQLVRLHQEALAVAETRVAVLEATAGPGMSFPVAGDVWFASTWHAPRPEGRLHLGVDIIAPWGAPVLAVESGVLYRAEWNRLGGWKMWLAGDSGATYYYGHFAAYAPAAFTGQRVKAGELIAWVGDTGAKGRPHLHIEVHPFGGDAVDPYPFVSALFADAPAPQVWVPLPSSLRDKLAEGFDAEPPVILPTTRQ